MRPDRRPRGVLAAAAAILLAAAGCADGSEPTPSNPEAARTGPVFTAEQVRRAFGRNGLPLTEPLPRPGGEQARLFRSNGAGPIFEVELYPTAEDAPSGPLVFVLRPAGYRIRGEVLTERKGNVVVTYEQGRSKVRARLREALAALG
jgi:hypothetical protein